MLFLDSADRNEIAALHNLGVIEGVTTNPTILCRAGIVHADHAKWCTEMAELIHPSPLSYEVTAQDAGSDMIAEARVIGSWAKNMVVKVPIHGTFPMDLYANLQVISDLEGLYNVRVNVTAMMSAQQCYLSALAGASYVSLFGGRISDMGYDPIREIERYALMRQREGLRADLIVGSVRIVTDVMNWLVAGADIVTVPPQYFNKMQWNPRTAETVTQFVRDAEATK